LTRAGRRPATGRAADQAEEVVEVLHIGRTRVYELMAGGALRSVKIGRLRCVPVDAVRDYLSELLESAA
jgi:excisionase family DNA binding protein